jgi:hypothetical protein
MGAAFVWFFVPETKRLTLEEMDVIFGSQGTAEADLERMRDINREIGLDALLTGIGGGEGGGERRQEGKETHVFEEEEKREMVEGNLHVERNDEKGMTLDN